MRGFKVALVVAAFVLPGCGNSTGPETPEGRYTLLSVGGVPLPIEALDGIDAADGKRTQVDLVGGSVALKNDGMYTLAIDWLRTETEASGARTLTDESFTETGTWILTRPGGQDVVQFVVLGGGSFSGVYRRDLQQLFFAHDATFEVEGEGVWQRD